MSSGSESSVASNRSSIIGDDGKRQITPATSVSEDEISHHKTSLKRSSATLEGVSSSSHSITSQPSTKRARLELKSPNADRQDSLSSPSKAPKLRLSLATTTLNNILKNPIAFIRASKRTRDDEAKASHINQFLQNQVDEHEARRQLTLNIPNVWPKGDRKRPAGLQNAHNFCYRRSVLQAFFHAPVFCSWLQLRAKNHALFKVHKPEVRCLICDFAKLVTSAWTKSGSLSQSLKAVDMAIRQAGPASAYPWTANISQADAHEFMSWLVDRFEHKANPHKLTVEGLFKLRVLSEWTCQDCHEPHTSTPQDETGLSISIKPPSTPTNIPSDSTTKESLETCIARYFADEVSDARCSNQACQSLRNRPRHRTIAAAPEVLFVQLQRFESTYNRATRNFKTSKISKHVPIPATLDLSAHAADAARRKPGTWKYRLSSVVAHSGTLRFGHYVSYAMGPDGSVAKFDDDSVSVSTLQGMMRPEGSFTPYILTYLAE